MKKGLYWFLCFVVCGGLAVLLVSQLVKLELISALEESQMLMVGVIGGLVGSFMFGLAK